MENLPVAHEQFSGAGPNAEEVISRRDFLRFLAAGAIASAVDSSEAAGEKGEDELLQEALNKKGWLTIEHDLAKEGKGIYSPCIVPPDQYFCRSMVIGQGAMLSGKAKDAQLTFYYVMPANFGDRGHLATKTVVYDGNRRILPAKSKIEYSLPDQRTGHRNAMMFVHVPDCPTGVPVYSQALHWLMVPSSGAPTDLVMQRLAQQNPQVLMGLRNAVDQAARFVPPVKAKCGYKAQYCANLAKPYAQYVSGFVNNVGGMDVDVGEGRHAWVMVMVQGADGRSYYAFVDPLNMGMVPWGILDGYIPCAFSSETIIPDKGTFVNIAGGSTARFKSRSDNVGMVILGLGFLQNRQDIVFSDADLLQPPKEVQRLFEIRSGKRREVNAGIIPQGGQQLAQAPRVPQVAQAPQTPQFPVREQLPPQEEAQPQEEARQKPPGYNPILDKNVPIHERRRLIEQARRRSNRERKAQEYAEKKAAEEAEKGLALP